MKLLKHFLRWLPALAMMAAIFAFSSIPSREMPSFGFWDTLVKKGGHMAGYGLLALAFWYALRWDRKLLWLALVLSLAYAISDEFHQSFVPGRHPSWLDALLIDPAGSILSLGLASRIRRWKRLDDNA
jgi:VanZ family protein